MPPVSFGCFVFLKGLEKIGHMESKHTHTHTHSNTNKKKINNRAPTHTHTHTHTHPHTHTHTDRHTHTYTCARPTEKLLYTQPHLSGVVILPSPPSFSLSLFRSSYSHDLDRV